MNQDSQARKSPIAKGYWFALAGISSVWGGLITFGLTLDMFGTHSRLDVADGLVSLVIASGAWLVLFSERFRQRLQASEQWLWHTLAVLAAVIGLAVLWQGPTTDLLIYNGVVCLQLAIGFALLPALKQGYRQADDSVWLWIYLTLTLLLALLWLSVVNRPLTAGSLLYNALPGFILVLGMALLTMLEVIRQLWIAQSQSHRADELPVHQLGHDAEHLSVPLLLIDDTGKVTAANSPALRWHSNNASPLTGRYLSGWLQEDDWQALRITLLRQPRQFSWRTQWLNGELKRTVDLKISRRGEFWLVLVIEQDELATLSHRLEQVSKARDNLGYIVDHHLQPPVQALQQQLTEMSQQTDDTRYREQLRQLLSPLRRWLRLLQETQVYVLLDRHQLQARACRLDDITHQVGAEYHERLQQLRATLEVSINHQVRGDAGLLYEVAKQLVSNAIKFHSPQRRPQLHVYTQRFGRDKVAWCFADNGMGFKNQQVKRMLKPFSRGDDVHSIAGSGMGLALVDKIVDLHHGMFTIESSLEHGCLIKVVLPQATEG